MTADEQTRFASLYARLLQALKLQGMAKATIDAYSRALRRSGDFFDRCPDDLSADELNVVSRTNPWRGFRANPYRTRQFFPD